MKSLALKIQGYTAPTELQLPKLYIDAAIDESTVYAVDTTMLESWASQADATSASQLVNLVEGGTACSFSKNMTFTLNTGFNFTIVTNEYITLPEDAKLTDYNGCFAVSVWLKPNTSQTQINTSVFGWYNRGTPNSGGNATAEGGWGMRHASGNNYQLICGDHTASVAGAATMRQVGIARVKDGDEYKTVFYRNGEVISVQNATSDFLKPSTAPANAVLGDVVGSGDSGYWLGSIGRSWLTRKEYSIEEMNLKMKQEYQNNLQYLG